MQITEFCGRRSLYKGKCIQDRRQCHQGQKISDNLKAIQSVTQLCPTLGDPMSCSMPGSPVHHQLLELSPTHVHWVSEAIQPSQLCHHFLLLPSVFASIRVFSNESVLHIRWPKYWSFSFSISISNEYLGLISFRIDWFDLLAVQGTLKSLLQHLSLKGSILKHSLWSSLWSNFSHLYMTTGKTIALTYRDLCQKSDVSTF